MAEMTTDTGVENKLDVRKLQTTGRVDIPTDMHRAMGIEEGDKVFVKWEEDDNEIRIMPADPSRLE